MVMTMPWFPLTDRMRSEVERIYKDATALVNAAEIRDGLDVTALREIERTVGRLNSLVTAKRKASLNDDDNRRTNYGAY